MGITNEVMKTLDNGHPSTSIRSDWLSLNMDPMQWDFGSRELFEGFWGDTPETGKPWYRAVGGMAI